MKSNIAKVSVIIPLYNVEPFLARCLDSVLNQTLRDIEVIVVDDASTDESMKIAECYASKDARIQLLQNESNCGIMWTRYKGYEAATGAYICFCDSDDFLPTDALDTLFNEAVRTKADVVVGRDTVCNLLGKAVYSNWFRTDVSKSFLDVLMNHDIQYSLWGKLFKKELLQDYPYKVYKDLSLAEDMLLLFQMAPNIRKWAVVDKAVYYYVLRPTSAIHQPLSIERAEHMICASKSILDCYSEDFSIRYRMEKELISLGVYLCEGGLPIEELRQIAAKYQAEWMFEISVIAKYYLHERTKS